MASSGVPVVNILDDDVAPPASHPSSRKRSLAAAATSSSPDFHDAFSSSPPLHKRLLLAAKWSIALDDTPSPPRRRASSAPKPPTLVVDDDTDPSLAGPCSLVPGDVVTVTPDSVLSCSPRFRSAFSETPGSAEPCSIDLDVVVADTPGFTSPSLARPPASHALSSAARGQKSSGVSSLISLDSDDESDETMHGKHVINLPSNTPKSEPVTGPGKSFCSGKVDSGTSNDDKDLLTSPTGLDSTKSASVLKTKKRQKDHDAQLIEERQKKQQKTKKRQKERDAQLTEEKQKKQQEAKRLKEERTKLNEERKQKQQENKMPKEAMKAQVADKKDKEIQQWESGKLALKCITAEIDSRVVETGSIGGPLLSSLAEKGLLYKVTKNKISRSILWKMDVPDNIAEALSSLNDDCDMNQASISEVSYIVIMLQAEEFCDLLSTGLFFGHVQKVQKEYPGFTICYVTNKLMNYINKREQSQYKNHSNTWEHPPVEEVLCKLATHYSNVHSRQCIDEAEVAEHLVGLTSSLAKCKFRKPLTWLSVHANGAVIPKGFIDKGLAKKDTWLKALIAIPNIQPRYALAIWKKYRTMRSLLNVYMDPSKTVLEKELLLSDLKWESNLGNEGKGWDKNVLGESTESSWQKMETWTQTLPKLVPSAYSS